MRVTGSTLKVILQDVRYNVTEKNRQNAHEAGQAKSQRDLLRELSDEKLMNHFQSGAVEAFNVLVERYSDRLLNYLQRFVKSRAKAEDLLQDTFIRVHRNRHAYRPIAKFSTWLYTIAGNLARSAYRKRKRYPTYSLTPSNREGEEYERPLPDESFSPDEAAESAIQERHIQDAFDQLPDKFQEVVVLRDVQELSYEEISTITGVPMGTVKSRIFRGRQKLQEILADVYPYQQN